MGIAEGGEKQKVMRVIKFRAKYFGDGKTWVFGDLIHKRLGTDCVLIQEDNGCASDCIPETVCQFTGSTDVDDNEIFEGDIVKQDEVGGGLYVVVFYEGAFRLATKGQKESLDAGVHPYFSDYRELPTLANMMMSAPFKVVGNIFENQDML